MEGTQVTKVVLQRNVVIADDKVIRKISVKETTGFVDRGDPNPLLFLITNLTLLNKQRHRFMKMLLCADGIAI